MALFIERSTVGMCIQCSATHYLESQTAQLLTSCLFQLKFPRSFLYYAENFCYYAGIMLYAFQPLLCLKLCWHNRLKPKDHSQLVYMYMYKSLVSHYQRILNWYITCNHHLHLQQQLCHIEFYLYVHKIWITINFYYQTSYMQCNGCLAICKYV